MYDLSTQAGVLRFCESKRAEMVRCFERVGRFEGNGQSFVAYLFATHEVDRSGARNPGEWKTGAKYPCPRAVPCRVPKSPLIDIIGSLDPNGLKDMFAHVLRLQGKLQKAIGYVLMTEMWFVKVEGTTEEEAQREREKMPESLEDQPGRGEALYMSVEHQALGQRAWRAEILREPTRLLEWEAMESQGLAGRFADLTEWRS